VHGFGLATKVQELNPSSNGLLANMLSFNVGIEVGQLLVLVGGARADRVVAQSAGLHAAGGVHERRHHGGRVRAC
jgi:hypothetical protein